MHFIQVRFQDHSWEAFTSGTSISYQRMTEGFRAIYPFAIGYCSRFSFYLKGEDLFQYQIFHIVLFTKTTTVQLIIT